MHDDSRKVAWPGWETVRLIGRGSFGAVYEIQRDLMGDPEKAALKAISIPQNHSDIEELYSDGYNEESITMTFQSHLKSILDEYSMMKKLNECINIVNCDDVHYVKHSDGIGWDIFIKMELLTPLPKALPEKITDDIVIKIAQDMCSALEMCKRYDVVHRDIKPQNIFVSSNGNYKLGDFGIAKTVEKTTGGTKIGTYKYMAPEVYHGKPYGTSADIYSLGLVLYWLLNERRMPFMPLPPTNLSPGVADTSRTRRFAGEPIPEPAHGSKELKQIILKACAYDPKNRYSSAAEMLRDLKQLGNGGYTEEPTSEEEDDKTIGIFYKPEPELDADDDITIGAQTKYEPAAEKVMVDDSDETVGVWVKNGTQTKHSADTITVKKTEKADAVAVKKETETVAEQYQKQKTTKKKSSKKLPIVIGAALVTIAVVVFLLLRGCDAGVDQPPVETTAPGETVVSDTEIAIETAELLVPEEPVELFVGDTYILQINGGDGSYKYETSDKKVATVNRDGEITAVGTGTATITVTSGDAAASVTVTIQDYEMTLSTDSLSLFTDATAKLEVIGVPEDAIIDWRSDNKKVAVVENGVVTAMSEGTATITATWENGKKTYTASATVKVETDGVTLSTYQVGSFYIGDTKTIKATTSREGQTITWTSSNNGVVTVNNGKITAVNAGTATITATAGSKSASCTVTVLKPSVSLNKSSVTAYIGDSVSVSATTEPGGTSVSWSSDNSGIATVNGGKITAVDAGTTTIRAKITHAGKSYETSCKITVTKPTVSLNKGSMNLYTGDSGNLSATTEPGGTSVSWSSDNSSIATVNGGKVTATGAGTATIRAKMNYGGKTYEATCKVTVSDPSVKLDKSSLSLMPGDSGKISANTTPGGQSVTWSSSNSSVATVSNGSVNAVAVGNATITAKISYGGKEYKATCTVTVEKPSISVTSSSSTIEFSEREQGTATLTATVKPDNGKIEWSISDSNVASIRGNGTQATVTAKSEGSVTVTATYTANGTTVQDTCTLSVKKAASTLGISGFGYPSSGTASSFSVYGTLSSNYSLKRVEVSGYSHVEALGFDYTLNVDPYYFNEGTYESNISFLSDYFIGQFRSLYNTYSTLATLLNADPSVQVHITVTVYDASGNTDVRRLVYTITGS